MSKKRAEKLIKKVTEDYNNISEEFHVTRKNDWKEFDHTLPYIKINHVILDIGCGNGRFFNFINRHHKVKYLGVDKSVKLIEKAISTHPEKEAKFIDGDLLNLPVADNFADVAVLFASLHHIPTEELRIQAIKEVYRVLKNKGIAAFTVWNLFQKKYKKYVWRSRIKYLLSLGYCELHDTFIPWGNSGVKRYYYAFKAKELRKLLTECGFEILNEYSGNNIMFICRKKEQQ